MKYLPVIFKSTAMPFSDTIRTPILGVVNSRDNEELNHRLATGQKIRCKIDTSPWLICARRARSFHPSGPTPKRRDACSALGRAALDYLLFTVQCSLYSEQATTNRCYYMLHILTFDFVRGLFIYANIKHTNIGCRFFSLFSFSFLTISFHKLNLITVHDF